MKPYIFWIVLGSFWIKTMLAFFILNVNIVKLRWPKSVFNTFRNICLGKKINWNTFFSNILKQNLYVWQPKTIAYHLLLQIYLSKCYEGLIVTNLSKFRTKTICIVIEIYNWLLLIILPGFALYSIIKMLSTRSRVYNRSQHNLCDENLPY